jgi:hypothetical protein
MDSIAGIVIALLVVCLIADGLLTRTVLRSGGRELNPVVGLMVKRLGVTQAVLLSRGIGMVFISVFWITNEISFLVGLLMPTIVLVCCGMYAALRLPKLEAN